MITEVTKTIRKPDFTFCNESNFNQAKAKLIQKAIEEIQREPDQLAASLEVRTWDNFAHWKYVFARSDGDIADYVFDLAWRELQTGLVLSLAPDAPEATQNDDKPKSAPVLPPLPEMDEEAIAAERAAAEQLIFKRIISDDLDEMTPRITAAFSQQAITDINQYFTRNGRRKLTTREIAFLACLHRRAIMINKHAIEDGKHCGDSPSEWCESYTPAEREALGIGEIRRQHATEIYSKLQNRGFAFLVREYVFKGPNHPENCSRRYAAQPSEFWGFPFIANPSN